MLLIGGCSTETASGSEESSVTEESAVTEETSETAEETAETAETEETTDEAGASDIVILDADSANTELSSGTYTVTIGNKTVTLSGAYVVDGIDAVITGGTYTSGESDQNVFLVINGGSLTLANAEIIKTGDAGSNDSERTSDVSDDYNFYGINSIILVVGEDSSAEITDCTLTSDCSGANAVFATDSAVVNVSNIEITTTGNSSRGVYATYEGTVNADHVTITTSGAHCAPIATDRGGGYVNVTNSYVSSSGDGSPSIYSTGQIYVENVVGVSTGAQAAVIEGKNSVTMVNCDFTVSGSGSNAFMLYQSMSGDAADSDATASYSTLTMSGTTITSSVDGPVFYVTNTTCVINLEGGNTFVSEDGQFLSASDGRWGTDGSNGGKVTLNVTGDTIDGTIDTNDISSVTVNLTGGAVLNGSASGNVTVSEQ